MGRRRGVILLDTHAWLWWVAAPDRLSPSARQTLADASTVGISTFSVFELATLVRRKRISLDRDLRDWVRRALSEERVEAIAPGPEIALAAAQLDRDEFPGDPADRLIFATARTLEAPLLTRDRRIRAFAPDATVW
ncbi:MAG: type II toxin-antitoxin system VapC family toxin [Solirubrobacteraceae bacterium]